MSKTTDTKYVIVPNTPDTKYRQEVARLLDDGYTLVITWVANDMVHHILSKNLGEEIE